MEQRCGTCYWALKEREAVDKEGLVEDVIGSCQYPLPFFIKREEVSFMNDGMDCDTYRPVRHI